MYPAVCFTQMRALLNPLLEKLASCFFTERTLRHLLPNHDAFIPINQNHSRFDDSLIRIRPLFNPSADCTLSSVSRP